MIDQQLFSAVVAGGFAVVVAMIGTNAKAQRAEANNVQRALGRIEGKLEQHLKECG